MTIVDPNLDAVRNQALQEAAAAIRDLIHNTAQEHATCEHKFKDGAEAALYEVLSLMDGPGNLYTFLSEATS